MSTAYTPSDVSGGVNTQTTINANWTAIQTALSRQLNRYGDTGTGDNVMHTDLDLNSNDLLNGGTGNFTDVVVGGIDLTAQVALAQTYASNSSDSADASAASAVSAASYATAASASATLAGSYVDLFATTKGSLNVGDGTTVGSLGVGTNGYALVADSTQSLGMAWAALSDSRFGLGTLAFADTELDGADTDISTFLANYVRISSVAASGTTGPIITSRGTVANIDLNLRSKGSSYINLSTNGTDAGLRVNPSSGSVDGIAIQGGGGSASIYTFGSTGNVDMNLVPGGTGKLWIITDNGAKNAQFTYTASSVNYFQVGAGAVGTGPSLTAAGDDTDINITLTPKGTGIVVVSSALDFGDASTTRTNLGLGALATLDVVDNTLWDGGGTPLAISNGGTDGTDAASARAALGAAASGANADITSITGLTGVGSVVIMPNAGTLSGTTTTGGILALVQVYTDDVVYVGAPSNTSSFRGSIINLITTASGSINLKTNSSLTQVNVSHTASAVNYLSLTGGATTVNPTITVGGSDTNIGINFSTKGNRGHGFYTNAGANIQFAVIHTASTVNWVQTTGASTGGSVSLGASGSDTNVGLVLYSRGTGSLLFKTQLGSTTQVEISNTTSAVNYLTFTGAITTGAPAIAVAGSDANIAMTLSGKGTNGVRVYSGGNAGVALQVLPYSSGHTANIAEIYDKNSALAFAIDANGNNILGGSGATMTTTSTDGFPYLPGASGTPTGTPTAVTGHFPIYVDSSGNKLWVYHTSAWHSVDLSP